MLMHEQKELHGRQIQHPRGKVLGGSSAIFRTSMIFNSRSAANAWEKLGNPGWDWVTMLPYIRRFHTQAITPESFKEITALAQEDEGVHSSEGPVQTGYCNTDPADKAWYEAWVTIMNELKFEGRGQGGFVASSSIDPQNRTRSYATTAYYSEDISRRSNLRVVTEALVERIVLKRGKEVTASGVHFVSKTGDRFTIHAKKEVILSAGTMQSPQLLELSGIGSRQILDAYGIEMVVENPNVGENLQDHAASSISFEVADGVQTADPILRDPRLFQSLLETYNKDRSGPLGQFFSASSHISPPETFRPSGKTFLSTLLKQVSPDSTDKSAYDKFREEVLIDLFANDDGATAHIFLAKLQFNTGAASDEKFETATKDGNFFTLFASLNHPFSRGSVHINSASPADKPTVDPRYLSHPMDIELLARHVQLFSRLISTNPLSKCFMEGGMRIPSDAFPDGTEAPSLDKAKELVRRCVISNYHPAGTCAMMKKELGGVVDERLRVFGVTGLRVVDASIFPLMPRGNPISTVYAVAERAVDLVREDWKGL